MITFDLIFIAVGAFLGSVLALRGGSSLARRWSLHSRRKLGHRRRDVSPRVPLIAGFGLAGGVALGLLLALPIRDGDVLLSASQITEQLWALIAAVAIVWIGGLAADRQKGRRSTAALILVSQIAAVTVLLGAGVRIRGMSVFGWPLGFVPSVILTAAWLFLMMQFSRFLDGIDGLLPLVSLALVIGQMRVVWDHPEPYAFTLGVVCLVVFAVLLAVNWYPARMYLGRNGSAIPGLLLGMLAIAARTKSFLTASAVLPLLIILPTLGFIGLRLLERSLLAVRLPRWNDPLPPSGNGDQEQGRP